MTVGHLQLIEKRLRGFLQTNHIRHSDSRDTVLQLLLEAKEHLELPELIERARDRQVGEATVYRALKVFQRAGLVSRIVNPGGHVAYEIPREHHDHMICTRCAAVVEFRSGTIERIQERIADSHQFTIHYHQHEIFGLCAQCTRETTRPKRRRVGKQRKF